MTLTPFSRSLVRNLLGTFPQIHGLSVDLLRERRAHYLLTRTANGAIIVPMEQANIKRALDVNRSQIDSWLWRARHAIRKRNARLALEATASALWLMGAGS